MQHKKSHKIGHILHSTRIDRFLKRQLSSKLFSYGKIFAMLVPIILDQFFINSISLLTTAMISSSSQESVSAISLINPLSMMIWAIFSAISLGGTVVVAQYKGKGDTEKMRAASGQVMLATFLVAIISCIILITCSEVLIHWMFGKADPLVIDKARGYLIGIAISQIFLSIYMGAFAVFRGMGATNICLWLTIIINIIHLLASLLFINIMKLDILGTSLSLNVARLIGAIVAVWMLMYPKSILKIHLRYIFQIERKIMRSIFRLGVPFALEQVFFNGGSMLVQTYLVQLGTVSIAANAIGNSAFSIIYSSGLAVGTLTTTIIGQCIGANEKALAKKYGMKMVWLGTVITILSIVVFMPLMPFILKLYQAPVETISLIYKILIIGVIPMPFFWSLSNITPAVLRSAGDATFTSVVSLITMWIFRVGMGYLFAITFHLGISGIWLCMGIEWLVRSVVFYLRFRSEKWLTKSTID